MRVCAFRPQHLPQGSALRPPLRAVWALGVLLLALSAACRAQTGAQAPQTFMVPMRDGVKLATLVVLPEGKGPWPVVFTRTPYGKGDGKADGGLFARFGYARVVQDMRGRFESEGNASIFATDGWGEQQDGRDTIDWIARQPWCDGNVGMIGGSALGITQYLAASALPPALKCCIVQVADPSLYNILFPGGVLRKADLEGWTQANKLPVELLQGALANSLYSDTWRHASLLERVGQVQVPMIHEGGWYDMFAQGTLDAFDALQHRGGEGARGNQRLIFGPWVHGCRPGGELSFPPNASENPGGALLAPWLDRWLRGRASPALDAPPVSYYVMGACGEPGAPGNEWRTAPDWPVPAAPTPLYLHAGGQASFDAPKEEKARRTYRYDPANPVPTRGGCNLTLKNGPADQRPVEGRDDVLLFTTDPLEKPLEVTGHLFGKLYVASDGPDTDFTAKLTDVYPDGRSMLVCEGILRLSRREGFEKEAPARPGQAYEVKVDLWSTSLIFNKGHRVRVAISSSNSPRFAPNPNNGGQGAPRVATNTLLLDRAHPSQILLPLPIGETR